jgi:hypothetical protein
MNGDGLPYSKFGYITTWFYFSVKNFQPGKIYTFCIKNMANQGILYRMGMKSVYKIEGHTKWQRIPGEQTFESLNSNKSFELTFKHQFEHHH